MTLAQIATRMGNSRPAVCKLIRKGRARLRAYGFPIESRKAMAA